MDLLDFRFVSAFRPERQKTESALRRRQRYLGDRAFLSQLGCLGLLSRLKKVKWKSLAVLISLYLYSSILS